MHPPAIHVLGNDQGLGHTAKHAAGHDGENALGNVVPRKLVPDGRHAQESGNRERDQYTQNRIAYICFAQNGIDGDADDECGDGLDADQCEGLHPKSPEQVHTHLVDGVRVHSWRGQRICGRPRAHHTGLLRSLHQAGLLRLLLGVPLWMIQHFVHKHRAAVVRVLLHDGALSILPSSWRFPCLGHGGFNPGLLGHRMLRRSAQPARSFGHVIHRRT
mmetsp:Transcript_73255/g.185526  ORF Transcript_73255/g.185526 Transcript_73255/m.185526 type:complete len:217 (+) Transcript_73255:688-1338(+)